MIQQIIRAENMISWFPDRAKADAIYDRAEEQLGATAPLLHQRGIHEMQRAEDREVLERAGVFLERAAELAPHNRVIRHSMAELALKRARLSDDELERVAWRKLAESTAGDLTVGSRNSYPHHTLLKAAIDGMRDALERVEHRADELPHRAFEEAIKKAEDLLRRSLEKFPNDEHLLAEEATLSTILQDANRALVALEKASAANPKGELIPRRLARVYRGKSMIGEAVKTLRCAIEYNPAIIDLNYELALVLMDEEPGASINKSDAILYHLERSFVSGDKRYQARFWYARQLCLTNNYDKAKSIFENLRGLPRLFSVRMRLKVSSKTTMDLTRCSMDRSMH